MLNSIECITRITSASLTNLSASLARATPLSTFIIVLYNSFPQTSTAPSPQESSMEEAGSREHVTTRINATAKGKTKRTKGRTFIPLPLLTLKCSRNHYPMTKMHQDHSSKSLWTEHFKD
ncbi:hypothetical protein GUJ93_ZPchr0011g27434 [Zizania palustris]|uniref:Uncharacterized protein n=1 Tax=Zizania palustris TaxID=103762 RepID=A0A8J5WJ51_ZIZPA|nr:hypothetical protein GUJ93_ZPchr0011g27434 [Zizania palustris]